MSTNWFMGIDPGQSGGIVVVRRGAAIMHPISDDLYETWETINEEGIGFALIEEVHSMPGQGVASTFKFGRSLGNLEAMLVAANVRWDYVRPVAWQGEYGLLKKSNETKTQKKNRHKQKAKQLYPAVAKNVTHKVADALLIADYCERMKHDQVV